MNRNQGTSTLPNTTYQKADETFDSQVMMNVFKKNNKRNTPSMQQYNQIIWKRIDTPVGSFFKEAPLSNRSKRKTQQISKKEMLQVLHLPQNQASKLLDCSLSTLKRRFYELKDDFGLKSWPQCFAEVRHLPIFRQIYPMSLDFILNTHEKM